MALSNKRILEEMEKGDIVITPFDEENLSTSSYDVALGEYYFSEHYDVNNIYNVYNLYNKEDTDRVWGTEPLEAKTAREVFKHIQFDFIGIDEDDRVILLEPGASILAHTNEFIGGVNHITTSMQARSSLGRNFIEVCKCAGWGDIGFTSRWTMEITNNSKHYNIPLVVGRRIAQIIFFESGETTGDDYAKKGKYQKITDHEELLKTWNPTDMLPKMYHDREVRHTH